MRYCACAILILVGASILQTAAVPALPPVLRPDILLLAGASVLAFASAEFGFVMLFLLGLQADLIGSPRLGAMTISYLLAGAAVRALIGREFERGESVLAWLSVVAATLVAHASFCVLALILGLQMQWGQALGTLVSLVLAACVWGFPMVFTTAELMFWLRALAPGIQSRWENERRIRAAQKRHAST